MFHHLPPPQAALPLQLMLASLPWFACNNAWQLSKSGSPNLKGMFPLPGNDPLAASWNELLNQPELAQTAAKLAKQRLVEFLEGIARYQKCDFKQDVKPMPVVRTSGGVKLRALEGNKRGQPVVLVPSLINRYYILDLTQRLSFARYLHAQGMRVFVVDWGDPHQHEQHFTTADYVSKRLLPLVNWAYQETGKQVTLGGYCMGGLLTLALACIKPSIVKQLACFATPWDFSVPEFPRVSLTLQEADEWRKQIEAKDCLPADVIHTLFHWANPYAYQSKMREFLQMKEGSQGMQDFVAIEHWVQDGVDMARGVAVDCLIDWMQHNSLARRQWHVAGKRIDPSTLNMPVFLSIPQGDTIVPSTCAMPLAAACNDATIHQPECGHVSMMVGKQRKSALWDPFVEWATG